MPGRNAVAGLPGAGRVHRNADQFGQGDRADRFDDVGVCSHPGVMHYALRNDKRLLHNESRYDRRMSDPAERLRIARMRAGFETGKDAAQAMGFPVSTYLAHENGSRGYPASKAFTYARKYKVREQWLLYGVGPGPGENDDPKAEVIDIFDHLPPLKRAEVLGYMRALSRGDS